MAKRSAALVLANICLDRNVLVPLHRQLYDQLRRAIVEGRLTSGTQLPSTRILSSELGVSRNTAQNAFEQLLAEGYLEGKVGSGTYVAQQLPDELLLADKDTTLPGADWSRPNISRRGLSIVSAPRPVMLDLRSPRPFQLDVPALDAFPFDIWSRLIAKYLQQPTEYLLGYVEAAGYRPLREAIAGFLGATRAVKCTPEQVIIVSSSQQAFDMVARVLLDPGDAVWVEDPGYLAARQTWETAGGRIVPVPVDGMGIDVEAGKTLCPNPRMVYVAPSHQFPTGVTMPMSRRLELLEWARESGAWVVEDDYNSEYRYTGPPPAALQGLDRTGRVVHVGTFRRSVFPGLGLGYMVVPLGLVDVLLAARALMERHSSALEQAVMADFIGEGHLARHLRRTRKLYAERQKSFLEAASRELGSMLDLRPCESGLHLIGWLRPGVDDRKVAFLANRQGVEVQPLSPQSSAPLERGGLMLGYAGFGALEIEEGVRRLAEVLRGPVARPVEHNGHSAAKIPLLQQVQFA
jgi:GntR family transcriptional regulator / MocR family aminotransferase